MNIFKFNITKSFEAFDVHHKVTVPVKGVESYIDVAKIRKGDILIFLVANTIYKVGIAKNDTFIGNISYFETSPCFTVNDLFTVDVEILPTRKELYVNLFLNIFEHNAFSSKDFCERLVPKVNYPELILLLNKCVFGSGNEKKSSISLSEQEAK